LNKEQDLSFWNDPPWGDGKQKYRLGLNPISQEEWLNREIGPELLRHKKQLLDNNYNDVGCSHLIIFKCSTHFE
jgi:hypothetical protein